MNKIIYSNNENILTVTTQGLTTARGHMYIDNENLCYIYIEPDGEENINLHRFIDDELDHILEIKVIDTEGVESSRRIIVNHTGIVSDYS